MNILWIITTQWRAQAFGYAGDPNARTPRLDALAAGSVNFAQAVTPHPFGPFARAALLTGVPSPENGVADYFDPLPASARTIAHDLAARGYATAFFGKWHLAKRNPSAPLVGEAHAKTIVPPAARGGFEFWEGFESGFLPNDPWLHGTRLPEPARFEGYQSDVLGERAAGWMQAAEETRRGSKPAAPREPGAGKEARPWFCCLSLEAPHPPYDAPAAGILPRDPREIILPANVPRGGETESRARRELAGYYAHLEATDRAIGRLVDSLPSAPPPLIFFTSVHGDMHGAHGLFRKGWPHEESIRVPLLVKGAAPFSGHGSGSGGPEAETINHEPVSLLDLPALTLAAIETGRVSAPHPRVERVAPNAFLGSAAPRSQISMPSVVRLPHQCDRPWRGVRTPERKLVLNADGSPWLYFNLRDDPLEMENLAADPARAREIADFKATVR